jgi:ferredoxin-thioredoxin reductase catalytic subunit/rubredoxin
VKEEQCISVQETDALYQRLLKDAAASGYFLNRDVEFAKDLVRSLILNNRRYGYSACPCRLASDNKEEDLDIICPCDYRDPDVEEYGGCYCSLYVSKDVKEGRKKIESIPERRPPKSQRMRAQQPSAPPVVGEKAAVPVGKATISLPLPVWRCKVCGYLCAREGPPGVCPICKAGKERFERFI